MATKHDPQLRALIAHKFREIRGDDTLAKFNERIGEVGLRVPKWNRYENAAETPSLETMIEVCRKLGKSLDWLLLDIEEKPMKARDVEDYLVDLLLRRLNQGKPRHREEFFNLVERAYERAERAQKRAVSNVSKKGPGTSGKDSTRRIS